MGERSDLTLRVVNLGHSREDQMVSETESLTYPRCRSGLRADCKPPRDPFRRRPTVNVGQRATKEEAPRLQRNRGAVNWSGRQDSNLRPLGPEPSALPG